ncbi:MAG: LysR family transcriptional regulator [Hyphomonadaceae bacterium]|nr:LysR family transcriptional regulator [Hyphomonadaceae bacterium]MBX3509878.1 LysR family transcriptional regulator [Hyphomonadaceae bacterium]
MEELGLKSLRSFRAILHAGSITAAARELGLSQPAVSRLLAKLERKIGFQLFHRDRGRLIPTPEALIFLEQVDHALGGIDRVSDLARNISANKVGQLKIVAPPSFSEGVLPDIVADFLERFPDVHLSLESRSVETAKAMIATREVDGGFVKRPVGRLDLREEPIITSECVCLIHAEHPLAKRAILDPRLLMAEPLILLGLGQSSRLHIEAAFAAAGVRPNVRIDTHTIASAAALASRRLGIAIVNALLARPYLREPLVERRFSPVLVQEYSFCTSLNSAPSRLTEAFLQLARQRFGKLRSPS